MLEEGSSGGLGRRARVCDSCRVAACAVYSRADSAYLCAACDARIHTTNRVESSQHERVVVCEACERAPAAFTCKADAAALCTTCDADIHSANPLARRHQRTPILPISGCSYGPWATNAGGSAEAEAEEEEEVETESWLLLNPVKNNNQSNGYLFGGEVDEYLDLAEYNSCAESFNVQQNQVKNGGSDSVVPVQGGTLEQQQQHPQNLQFDMEFEASKAGFSYNASMSHSVSLSSMDVSVVPDSTISDISNSHSRPPKGTIDLFSSPPLQIPPQFTPMDREARVLRYKEKKKTRKFEKTIRYASRKAYAETRPRIKGRFAKRTDVEVEVDQMFSTTVMSESAYGIVPSFRL